MTSATDELKQCPFCGGEASWIAARQREDGTYYPAACGCRKCGIWRYGESNYGHGGFATEEDRERSMKQAVSKWNTRTTEQAIDATLGGWKLTAEQVRTSIESRFEFDLWVPNARWQAIADELNATLGGGECEVECFDDGVDEGMDGEWFSYAPPTWYLSCGHEVQGTERPNYCVVCGKHCVHHG